MPRHAQLRLDETRAWHAFLQAHHRVLRELDRELEAEEGLSLGAYELLLWLAQAPEHSMRMVDLAEVVLLSPSGLTRLVDRLVQQDLVERLPCPEDRRATYAHLTPTGLERFRRAARVHTRGIREHFTGRLQPEQLRALTEVLEHVNGTGATVCPTVEPAG
jgi:DNA-binding MarR family transcriptional regulator